MKAPFCQIHQDRQRSLKFVFCGALASCLLYSPVALAKDTNANGTEVVGHVLKPKKLEPTSNRLKDLSLPEGFKIDVFAEDLINPRVLAVSDDGTLYATRRSVGDVVMVKDKDGDGKADQVTTVAGRPNIHGMAIDGDTVYLMTVKDIYKAKINDDGSFGELNRIVDDLPDAGQHPNRTLTVGPDGMLYVSVGSTCNACNEPNPENATLLQVKPDGSFRRIFASGLRNTIGFAFEPKTGKLYGADHGIDWLGDDEQPEEINIIEEGKMYGWPYIYGEGGKNPQDEPPAGMTLEEWAEASETPVLTYTAHAAPMQLAFYTGNQFPAEYQGDAILAMRGSWNRQPPSGYEVVRIDFEDGKASAIKPFISGFLKETDGGYGYIGRPVGLAVAKDGSLFIGDDSNGTIYRVSYDAATLSTEHESVPEKASKNAALADQATPEKLATALLEADQTLEVDSPVFEAGERLPQRYSAYGQDFSPELSWTEGPQGTKSYVVIVEDPDASSPKPFVHWVLYNIPADVTHLREGVPGSSALPKPKGARQAMNSRGSFGYFGPRPPADGDHHYHFQVFALNGTLNLKPDASRKDVLEAMNGHVLAKGDLVALYRKSSGDGS